MKDMPQKPRGENSARPETRLELLAAAPVHRRAFFSWCGAGTLTTTLAASLSPATARGVTQLLFPRGQLMLNEVTQAQFAEHVGSAFQFEIEAGRVLAATLVEARLLPVTQANRPDARRAAFSLIFRLSTRESLRQRIYGIEHPQLGRMEIFLVPVGRESGDLLLEAIFN